MSMKLRKNFNRVASYLRFLYELIPPEWDRTLDEIELLLKDVGWPIDEDVRRVKRGLTKSTMLDKMRGEI